MDLNIIFFVFQDIKKQVSDMTNVTITLNNITLMTPALEQQLNDFLHAGLDLINFDSYKMQVKILPPVGSKHLIRGAPYGRCRKISNSLIHTCLA